MEIKNSIEIHKNQMSKSEHLAIWITNKVGTVGFFSVIFLWTFLWLGWNMFAPLKMRFDPFPGFVLWLFISNMVQIFLLPLIMIGQNLQGKHAEIISDNDYHINLKAENEITQLQKDLQEIKILLKKHLKEN